MKKLTWKLILPLTIISMMIFTKWWYVLIEDGPDELMTGFPFAFVCNAWHTSLSLQIFVLEFIVDFLFYFVILLLIVYSVNKYIKPIVVSRLIQIPLFVVSGLILALNLLIACISDNIYYVKRNFNMEILDTGYKFIWQKQDRPNFNDYRPEYKNNHNVPKSVLRSEWDIKADSIDLNTLIDHGQFLTDNDRVYYKYDYSCGLMIIELKNVDRATFKTFGNTIYAKDKNHIYDSRHGIVKNADMETFHVVKVELGGERIIHGKDKNNYFFWDKIITDTVGYGAKTKDVIVVN